MTCEEFRALLDRDGAAAAGTGAEHLRACLACRRELARWQEVERELAALGDDEVPPFLHQRIMAHVRAEGRGARRMPVPWWRPVWVGPVLVVALLAALGGVGLWHLLRDRPSGKAVAAVADESSQPTAPPAVVGSGPPVPDLVSEEQLLRQRAPRPADAALPPGKSTAVGPQQQRTVAAAPAATWQERAEAPALRAAEPAAATPPPFEAAKTLEVRSEGEVATEPRLSEERRVAERRQAAVGLTAERQREVRCQLLDDEAMPVITLWLPADAVPEEGTMWMVRVGEEKALTVTDERGRELRRIASLIEERAPHLPPPGRYRLTQAPLPEY